MCNLLSARILRCRVSASTHAKNGAWIIVTPRSSNFTASLVSHICGREGGGKPKQHVQFSSPHFAGIEGNYTFLFFLHGENKRFRSFAITVREDFPFKPGHASGNTSFPIILDFF